MKYIVSIVTILGIARFSFAQPTTRPAVSETMTLGELLYRFGPKLAAYFTIEADASGEKWRSPLEGETFSRSEANQVQSNEELVTFLKTHVPRVRIILDADNPKVIHIIDASLDETDEYILNQKRSLKFSGTPSALLERLDVETEGAIKRPQGFVVGGEPVWDNITQLEVDTNNSTYRSIFSKVPLAVYGHTLWRAESRLVQGKRETSISFRRGETESNNAK